MQMQIKGDPELKNEHTSGEDEIPISLIIFWINEIKYPLSYIITNSLQQRIFPKRLKLALVKLLYNEGNPEVTDNYRLIRLFPSKLFELAMCRGLMNYLNSYHLFNETQHGYIQGRPIDTAIYQFIQTYISIRKKNIAVGFFVDLSCKTWY